MLAVGSQALGYQVEQVLSEASPGELMVALGRGVSGRALIIALPGERPEVDAWLRRARLACLGAPGLLPPTSVSGAGPVWVVSELSLDSQPISSRIFLGVGQLLQALKPVFECLATLHDRGSFHGAVTPALLVTGGSSSAGFQTSQASAPQLALAGMGLLELAGASEGRALTPASARAPEVTSGAAPSSYSDVYSLAAIVTQLLPPSAPAALRAALAPGLSGQLSERPADLRSWWRELQRIASTADDSGAALGVAAGAGAEPRATDVSPSAQDAAQGAVVGAQGVAQGAVVGAQGAAQGAVVGAQGAATLEPSTAAARSAAAPPAGGVEVRVEAPRAGPKVGADLPPPSWLAPRSKASFAEVAPAAPAASSQFVPPALHAPAGEATVVDEPAAPLAGSSSTLTRAHAAPLAGSSSALTNAPAAEVAAPPSAAVGTERLPGEARGAVPNPTPSPALDPSLSPATPPGAPWAPSGQRMIGAVGAGLTSESLTEAPAPDSPMGAAAASAAGTPGAVGPQPGQSGQLTESGGAAGGPPPAASVGPMSDGVGAPSPSGAPMSERRLVAAEERQGRLFLLAGGLVALVVFVLGVGGLFAARLMDSKSAPKAARAGAAGGAGGFMGSGEVAGAGGAGGGFGMGMGGPAGSAGAGGVEVGTAPLLPPGAPLVVGAPRPDERAALLPLLEHTPVWGSEQALVTLVVFGDLECRHTRRQLSVLFQVMSQFPDTLRIAWVHTPLAGHKSALPAANLSAALARAQGGEAFWRLLSAWRLTSEAPTDAALERAGKSVGLTIDAAALSKDGEAARHVAEDRALGVRFGVRSTPTLVLNGQILEGAFSREALSRAIQSEVGGARGLLASGLPRAEVYPARLKKHLIDVGEDVPVRVCPAVGGSPTLGAAEAQVTIVQFSEFECRFCARVQPALKRLASRYPADVRLVWKHLPLADHPRARPAAGVVVEAHKRLGNNGFWSLHDALFAAQDDLSDAALLRLGEEAGLTSGGLQLALGGAHRAVIDADVREADRVGARGTPTFYINGRRVEGALDYEVFEAMVESELRLTRRLLKSGTERKAMYDAICGL